MPTPPKYKPKQKLTKPPPMPKAAVPTPKRFAVSPWTGTGEGEKILGYADTGMGKTTLFSMLPNPIFIGLDDGGRKIVNPKTGEPINHIPNITTYEDVRAALQQSGLFPKGSSCIIDTFTLLELKAEVHVLDAVPLPKGGGKAKNIKAYGWNEGSSHVLDALRLVLQDLDALVRNGVNVGLICQEQAITVANPEGLDYLQACPKLHHDRQFSMMLEACAWADHVFRIDYLNSTVRAEGEKITGKVVSPDTTRVISIAGAQHYRAKSRTLNRFKGEGGEPITNISFETPADDSVWGFLFPQEDN